MEFTALLVHPLVFNMFVLIASLYLLFKSADLLVGGISSYARKLGLSDALIGMIVVAMAASTPEIISSLTGFLSNRETVGFGTIIGSNMVHAAFALGLVTLIGKKIRIEKNIFTNRRFTMWLALMLPFVLVLDGELTRSDGIVLIGAFILYLLDVWRIEGTLGKMKKHVKIKTIWRDAAIFLGCLAALILAGRWLVFSSLQISQYINIPPYFIALTVIGIGTTLPDLAVELKSIRRAHANIGLGDLLGSLVIELLFFLGIVAIFIPIQVDLKEVSNALFFLAAAITLLMVWMKKKELTWKHGLVLIGLYLVFLGFEIAKII